MSSQFWSVMLICIHFCRTDIQRLSFSAVVLTMIFSIGEPPPIHHYGEQYFSAYRIQTMYIVYYTCSDSRQPINMQGHCMMRHLSLRGYKYHSGVPVTIARDSSMPPQIQLFVHAGSNYQNVRLNRFSCE